MYHKVVNLDVHTFVSSNSPTPLEYKPADHEDDPSKYMIRIDKIYAIRMKGIDPYSLARTKFESWAGVELLYLRDFIYECLPLQTYFGKNDNMIRDLQLFMAHRSAFKTMKEIVSALEFIESKAYIKSK